MLRRERRDRSTKKKLLGVGAAAGALALLVAAYARRGWRRVPQGLLHRVRPNEYDDATLAHKVESVIFRGADVPKGQILVNAQHGVVQLRGEVPSQDILDALVERTRDVQGVQDVESLLHLPGTPAPMH